MGLRVVGSLSGYAKHRKSKGLTGGSLAAVQKARDSKRISLESDGRVDFEKADGEWRKNSLARQQRKPIPANQPAFANVTPITAVGQAPEEAIDGTYLEAQRQEKWEQVLTRRLARKQKELGLIEFSKVNAWVAGMILRAASILDRIPDELSDRLAQQTDPIEVKKLLKTDIDRARRELAEYVPHQPANA